MTTFATNPGSTIPDPESLPPGLEFLAGGGEATRLILQRDWSGYWLGQPEDWPEALKVSLSLILNSPESMILCWGSERLAFFFNETYFPLLGPRLSWAMGSPFIEVWADGWEQAKPIIDEAFAGRARHFDDLPWKLGTDRGARDTWWSFSYSRVLDGEGAVSGLFIFTNDDRPRSGRHRRPRGPGAPAAGDRAAAAEPPADAGFRAILDGPRHVFKYVNDAYIAISGARDFINRSVRDVFPELEGQGFNELMDRVYQTGEAFTGRALPVRLGGDGAEKYVDLNYQPIRDDHGAVTGIFVGSYDVSEQVRVERRRESLIRLDDRLRDVADTGELSFAASELLGEALGVLRVGYGVLDPQAGIITVERDWRAPGISSVAGVHNFHDFGYYIDELRSGISVANEDVETDPRTAANVDAFRRIGIRAHLDVPVVEGGETVAQIFVHSSAPRVWSDDEVSLVKDFAERTRVAIARRRAEQALRDHNETLEARVAERSAALELAHDQLRQAQKMEAVGQLTGGLAHDFNNLLAGISGSLELMGSRLAQGRTAEVDKYLTAAQGAARRAASLTHRLLAFSRRQTLDPKPTNVKRLVAGMEDLVRRTVGPGIRIEVASAFDLWTALVDPPQLESALLNLCINSRDAMPEGGRIAIEAANIRVDDLTARKYDMPEGQYLSLSVSDTGTGMTPEVMAKAFDPFFTTKPIGEGTGLGLSMIYGFAKQSGGQVRIESELGVGTTVCIYLPRLLGNAEDADGHRDTGAAPRAQRGETVLVVDDEPTVRMLVLDLLEELGYTAIEAADSVAGLRELQSGARIDLLVTDVGLPGGMNGRQMAAAARAARPGLKVIFITGYAENALVGDGQLESGMTVLTKPFPMEVLGARIREMIATP